MPVSIMHVMYTARQILLVRIELNQSHVTVCRTLGITLMNVVNLFHVEYFLR